MEIISFLAGPFIGAVIGYFTNLIAVKMMFRPRKAIKIGGFTLPFTPGIIPKRRKSLSRVLGEAVGKNLLTGDDLKNALLSDHMTASVTDSVVQAVYQLVEGTDTVEEALCLCVGSEKYAEEKEHLEKKLCGKITASAAKVDYGPMIAEAAGTALKDKAWGGFVGRMLSEERLASIGNSLGNKVVDYIEEHGEEVIRPYLEEGIQHIEQKTLSDVLGRLLSDRERLSAVVGSMYQECIAKKADELVKQFDVAGTVEQKINDMDMVEMEKLILSVMNKEMQDLINLGAVIGFIIGFLNTII